MQFFPDISAVGVGFPVFPVNKPHNLDVVFEAKMCFIILLRPAGVFIFLAAFVDIIRP